MGPSFAPDSPASGLKTHNWRCQSYQKPHWCYQENYTSYLVRLRPIAKVERMTDVVSIEDHAQMAARMSQGIFTLRDLYEQFQNVMKMGPLGQVRSQCCPRSLECGISRPEMLAQPKDIF